MAEGGFDFKGLSMGTKGLLISGAVLLIAFFLPWQSVDIGGFGSVSRNGFNGLGILAFLLLLGLLIWEGVLAAGVKVGTGTTSPAMISAGLGAGVVVFTVLHFLLRLDFVAFGAFIGLVAALGIAYATWVRFNESKAAGGAGAAPPPPPA